MNWRCAANSEAGGALCPQPVATIAARSIDRAAPRTENNTANCAATKAALRVCCDPLSHRRCVHVTQPISELFHHMRRELRVLLNEKMETALIDRHQLARGLRHGVRSTRTVIDQRHLANERAFLCGLDHIITKPDVRSEEHTSE